MRYDAFIRFYSKDDLQLVSQYILSMINDGYSILVESSQTKSELVESVIEQAINNSALVIFFMPIKTNIFETSIWNEMNFANIKGKKIIHVLLENSENTLKADFKKENTETIRFDEADPSSAIKQLVTSIASYADINHSPDSDDHKSRENLFTLGKFYAQTENEEQAAGIFQSAAEQGYAPAQFELAHLYMYGKWFHRFDTEAEKWLLKSANHEYTPAQFELACNYIVGYGFEKDYDEALRWLQNAAKLDDSPAQVFLGQLYYQGKICEQNYSQAVYWFKCAAAQGNINAQYELGQCYLLGHGVSRNKTDGLKWLTFAAERDYPKAQFLLGLCHEKGYGVTTNYQEALKWYKLAAEKDFTPAYWSIGDFYMKGHGVTKNHQEALKWYKIAAKHGSLDPKKVISQLTGLVDL